MERRVPETDRETPARWRKIAAAILGKPLRRADAKSRADGDFLAVMPYSFPRIYYLNRTAAALYQALDGKRTGNELVDQLQAAFPDVDREILADDAAKFILGMIRCRVVKVAAPGGA